MAGGPTISDRNRSFRVASLLPSATEICYGLDIEPVATSHECDYPPAASDLPTVVESRIDTDAASADIDTQVQAAESRGGVYTIDRDALTAADPDLVVSQGLCDVCAVDTIAAEAVIDELGLDCDLLTTDPHSLADVFDDVRRIGRAVGREERASDLVADLEERVGRVEARTEAEPHRPEVVVLDWTDPVMVAGHWVPELIEKAGGSYGLAEPGDSSRPREWAEIRQYDPDILIVAPCGFGLEQTVENIGDLRRRDGWRQLRSVRMNRAYAMDGHHLMNRPGPRLVETLEVLAALIQPEVFEAPEPWAIRPLTGSRSR